MYGMDADNRQASEAAPLVRFMHLVRELAEASIVVVAFAVAILIVGTPIALAVRALHDMAWWLVRSL